MRVHRWFARATRAVVAAVFLFGSAGSVWAQTSRDRVSVAPSSLMELRRWDAQTERMLRDRDLRLRDRHEDKLIPGRLIERADRSLPGRAGVRRETSRDSCKGACSFRYSGCSYPQRLGRHGREDRRRPRAGGGRGEERGRTRPDPPAGARRAAAGRPLQVDVASVGRNQRRHTGVFVDAHDGSIVFDYSVMERQAAVGQARGVLGDTKKISVSGGSGHFTARDRLRPPSIRTLDMKGDLTRTLNILNGFPIGAGDFAADDDNNWTDGAVDDAHVYQAGPTTTTSSGLAAMGSTTTTSRSPGWPIPCAARISRPPPTK